MGIFGPNQNLVAFQAIAAHFGKPLSGGDSKFDIQRGACTYRVEYLQHKNTITLLIRALTRPMPDVELRKETGTDRFGKRVGLNYELQTGDALFDNCVFVVCGRDTAALERLLNPAAVRKGALFVLQSANFDRIAFDKKGFSTVKVLGGTFTIGIQAFEELLAALEMIEQGLPTFAESEIRRVWMRPFTQIGTLLTFLVIAGLILLVVGNAQFRPLVNSLYFSAVGAGIGAWLVSVILVGRYLRAKPDAFNAWLTWSILGLGIVPMVCVGLALVLNGARDTSAPVPHTAVIQGMHSTRHKNSTSYYLKLKSWRASEPTVEVKVPALVYQTTSIGRSTTITTKSGWLGWEWVVSP